MTNQFEPPRKQAFDDAELALAIQSAADALAAMEVLENQAKLRAEDAQVYVAWVREMESLGTAEAKSALSRARRTQAGLPETSEEPQAEVRDENSWQALVPDWQERQAAQLKANEEAVENARQEAVARLNADREAAIATAIAEAEAEAQRLREEAVEQVRRDAKAKRESEVQAAEEAARIAAESEAAARAEAERIGEVARLEREEAERIENELAAQAEAGLLAQEVAVQFTEPEPELEPEPVAAAGFATGSFDIVESAEQSVDEAEDNFDYLMVDGELPFAKEPASSKTDQPLSTISRRSKAVSQLFIWGGLTVGIAPLALAAFVSSMHNVGQGILAIAIGLLFSSALISVAAIAGKRSGLSTLILTRAAFGVHGNLISAIPMVIIKLLFGASVLYLGVGAFDGAVVGAPAFSNAISSAVPGVSWQPAVLGALLLLGGTLAVFGGKVLYWAQLVAGAIGAIAVLAFIAATAGQLDWSLLTVSANLDFVTLVATSSVVGIFFGAFWITAVAEFTRKVPMRESGTKVSVFVALATGVLPLLISSYALLALESVLSKEKIDAMTTPVVEVLRALPQWASTIVLYSSAITLLIWIASWMYATSVSFASIGAKLRPLISQPIILVLSLMVATTIGGLINFDFVSVIVLAWAGVFVGDVACRRIAYHEVSLARDYGFYRAWNLTNVGGFVLAVALGLGTVSSVDGGWSWLGYITDSYANVGIYVAVAVGFVFPILFGRKRIQNQEAEVLKIESRRHDLADVSAE